MTSSMTKTNIIFGVQNSVNNKLLHIIIQKYLLENINFNGFITLDYRNRIRIENSILIPFNFQKQMYFKYINTFQQNNKHIKHKIHKYVINLLENEIIPNSSITCIGGESYFYPIYINNNTFIYYTNSKDLYEESIFNTRINFQNHKNIEQFKIIDYNNIKIQNIIDLRNETIIINLSKLNQNLIKIINNIEQNQCKNIIIINCNHKDFWKKIKLLTNFKLITREKFIGSNYFITVSLFIINTI